MRPTILLTRPTAQSERFAQHCRDAFGDEIQILISPILDIAHRPLKQALPPDAILVFSSENAVHAVAPGSQGQRAYCVGDRTAAAASDVGFDACSASGTAQDLIAEIITHAPRGRFVYLRGAVSRINIAKELRSHGLDAQDVIVYDQVPRPLTHAATDLLNKYDPVVLPVFSPRSAQLLSEVTLDAFAPVFVAALSDTVAQAWTSPAKEIQVAQHPDAPHMMETLRNILSSPIS